MRLGPFVRLLLAVSLAGVGASPVRAQDASPDTPPTIVVSTEVLGAIVSEVVGDAADVQVLMSGGVDPHSWQPSARETAALFDADLVVVNGAELEEGLLPVLEVAKSEGVPIFEAAAQIEPRDAEDEVHGPIDPHLWLDPLTMRDVVRALGPALESVGVEVEGRDRATALGLVDLDAEIETILAAVPEDRRLLVTGHDSLGYFADRYGFTVVGTVIPGRSTSAEPSARDLSELSRTVRDLGVTAVFAEVGTPQSVARSLADDTGARMIELDVTQLPADGGYAELMLGLARAIADGLAPAS